MREDEDEEDERETWDNLHSEGVFCRASSPSRMFESIQRRSPCSAPRELRASEHCDHEVRRVGPSKGHVRSIAASW